MGRVPVRALPYQAHTDSERLSAPREWYCSRKTHVEGCSGMSVEEPVPMTKQGVERLEREIEELESIRLPKAQANARLAREQNADIQENLEYTRGQDSAGHAPRTHRWAARAPATGRGGG